MKSKRPELHWIKSALETLSAIGRGFDDILNEEEFLRRISRVAVSAGPFALAWIGLLDKDKLMSLKPVVSAGNDDSVLAQALLARQGDARLFGPATKALNQDQTIIVADILNASDPSPWRESALASGFTSAIALPLHDDAGTSGVLSVCAVKPRAFGTPEAALLEEIAGVISFGVGALRRKARLVQPADKSPSSDPFQDPPQDGIFIMDDEGLNYVNVIFEAITGYAASEVCGRGFKLASIVRRDGDSPAGGTTEAADNDRPFSVFAPAFTILTKNGGLKYVENQAVRLPGPRHRILGILRDVTDLKQSQDDLLRLQSMFAQTLGGVAEFVGRTVEECTPFGAGHQRRVSELAQAIARELSLPRDRTEGLRVASLIHDIGMIGVPSEVLAKPGGLSASELDLVRKHPAHGYNLLKSVDFPGPTAEIVLQHHERNDGSGYPEGLASDRILLEAKILHLADVVEAMSSPRAYRPAWTQDQVLEEINRQRGAQFDGEAVEACRRLFIEKDFHFPIAACCSAG